jgi:tetratricopeptide (TPR) repeat protein
MKLITTDFFNRCLRHKRGPIRGLLLLLVLSSPAALADDAFQEGIDAYHQSEYGTAASAFERATREEETAAAHHNLALALYQQGKISEAAWHLERALLLEPENKPYHFKLGALRQQMGLPVARPEWHELASRMLSRESWIILLSAAFWITAAALWLPRASGSRISLPVKAARTVGLIVLILAAAALYQNRHLGSYGIVIGDSQLTLHAAPASAAPQVGLARPAERAQRVDQHGGYLEIETEGGARGWLEARHYRLILPEM